MGLFRNKNNDIYTNKKIKEAQKIKAKEKK